MKLILPLACTLCLAAAKSGYAQSGEAFMQPAQVVAEPASHARYAVETRRFTGIPSLAVSPGGRMWATWYAGVTPGEDANNYVVLATSGDKGKTWEEILVVDPDGEGPVRAFDPEIWVDPDGALWLFWAQTVKHDGRVAGVWTIRTGDPENRNAAWSSPRRLTDGVMMCKPTVLSSGEWLLPASTWRETDNSARVIASTDRGKTWALQGACHIPKEMRRYDEHMLVERLDGALWMWVRTNDGIGESVSTDKGKSWSTFQPSAVQHPSSRFFVRRLASGNLLLVKHGPIEMKTGRSHLMAFLSQNDGQSWSRGLLLDSRSGIAYPDGQQDADGTIHIVYDHNRKTDQEIWLVSFTEEDILAQDYDVRIVKMDKQRKTVSAGGQKPKQKK